MKDGTYNIIKATISSDDSIPPEAKRAILEFCRNPVTATQQSTIPEQYLPPRTVAQRLQVSLRTVQRWVEDGSISSKRIMGCRRIPESALEHMAALPYHHKKFLHRPKGTLAVSQMEQTKKAG